MAISCCRRSLLVFALVTWLLNANVGAHSLGKVECDGMGE